MCLFCFIFLPFYFIRFGFCLCVQRRFSLAESIAFISSFYLFLVSLLFVHLNLICLPRNKSDRLYIIVTGQAHKQNCIVSVFIISWCCYFFLFLSFSICLYFAIPFSILPHLWSCSSNTNYMQLHYNAFSQYCPLYCRILFIQSHRPASLHFHWKYFHIANWHIVCASPVAFYFA